MKIRAFVVLVLIVCGILVSVFYGKATRASVEEKAITEAIQARNTPQLIQALITRMKNQMEKNDDTFPELIKEVEDYATQTTDSAGVAVLHSMIAEMYQNYYMQNRWNINSRTNLIDYIPEDIREWTTRLFEDKIKHELTASLQPAALLQSTPISQYNLILEKGKDSPALRPTLFDFLVFRAIQIQPAAVWYNDLLAFRRTQPDKKALLLDELDYLSFTYSNQYQESDNYRAALDSLFQLYRSEPYAAEICIAQLNQMEQQLYRGTLAYQDSMKAAIYSFCQENIGRYPQYERINILKNKLSQMEMPILNVQTGHFIYPGKNLELQIKYTNTPSLTIRIYQSARQPEMAWKNYNNKTKQMRGKLLKEQTYKLDLKNSYSNADTTLHIPMDKLGLYEYVITVPGTQLQASACFSVSRLATLTRGQREGNTEVLIADLESGKPIDGAVVSYYRSNAQGDPQKLGEVKTDKDGLATLPAGKKIETIRPVFKEDSMALFTTVYPVGTARPELKEQAELSLFTDRGIYRPGQTIFFKGIAYVKDTDKPHVVAGAPYTVILRDANYKEVATKTFTTDAFGAFNGEFTIPQQTLSGNFTLSSERAQAYVRIEEYKRPTFKVDIQPIKAEVTFGKPVLVEGTANTFSGVSLQTGEVKWQITRRPFWVRMYMPNPFDATYSQVASGTATINEKGDFSFSFTPERTHSENGGPVFQSYEVSATLTDSKGETEEARYTFSVGDTGILLTVLSAERMERDSARIQVDAYTANGVRVNASGSYTISSLSDKPIGQTLFGTDSYQIIKQVSTGNFNTDQPLTSSVFRSLSSGRYRIEVKAADRNGQEVTAKQDFILYGRKDKRPPVFMHTWLVQEQTNCLPGEDAEFTFGTSEKQAHILYEVYSSERTCIERKYIELTDENRTFRIPFKEEYGNGIVVTFTFVKEGRFYVTQVPIQRRQPDRRLTIRTETFRNHLLPGSKENWKFRITDADSDAVSAQVLASMYDASLDQIMPFAWSFLPQRYLNLFVPLFTGGSAFSLNNVYETGKTKEWPVYQYQYDQLDWQDVLRMGYRYDGNARSSLVGGVMMKSAAGAPVAVMESLDLAENVVASDTQVRTYTSVAAAVVAEGEREESGSRKQPVMQLRENFAETAFFYPVLVTDAQGAVAFSFTMPESNTTWKLQLLAQTEDLKYGYLTKEVITSKPLMVLPNLPRFLRQGDEVTITSQVMNQKNEAISGRVRLELFDPATDQPVVCLTKSEKPFTLAADSTATVSWSFLVPVVTDGLIGCRIVADSDGGSDGEQHLVPVLSDQILVTESQPFYLFDQNEQVIRLKDNKNSTPFRLTLELTANPIWYAVQALPTVTQPDNENIISWFASYYSNTLANYIAVANPRIQQVVSQWKAQGGTASTLYSNLEKNAELKNILLQETPWVLAADNETEQKQRLSLLFDLNRASQQRDAALQQLLQQQMAGGGWGWFKGLVPSREITLYILKGMAQLTQLGAVEYNQQEKEMQIKALNYLDSQIQQDYEQAQKADKNWQNGPINSLQLDYLFVRSSFRDIPELGSAREAIRFYTAKAEKQWSKQSLYGKGETALLMQRNGKKEVANAILAWLRKTATTTPDKGMYWANNRRDNNYFTSPIDTHCLLMSVFQELSPNGQETDRMKQWLLSQKQTQSWESVPATLNAIYALLLTGSDWLNASNACTAQWGGQTYSTTQGETATGYLKVVLSDPKATTSGANSISIRKEGSAPAWGAVYEQYFQNMNQIQKQKGVLNVEKRLFVETNNGTERQLRPVNAGQSLQVGDRVTVRLTIRTDREMDYVFLKDLRAGCFEPTNQLSGSMYRDGVGYYQSPTDVSENFFFTRLPQGTYVLEYSVYVSRTGRYAGGISTIQCLYAPEFVSHTEGYEVIVK